MSATTAAVKRMDDLEWPRQLNKVITKRWSQLKNTLVMKDFVDYLIQKRVVTLDYWMGLKSKPISESERTEDFLSLVMKFDQQKYNYFMEALLSINRHDLVKVLVKAQTFKKAKDVENELKQPMQKKVSVTIERSQKLKVDDNRKNIGGQTDADQLPNEAASYGGTTTGNVGATASNSGTTARNAGPSASSSGTTESNAGATRSKSNETTSGISVSNAEKSLIKKPVSSKQATNNLHKESGNVEKQVNIDEAKPAAPNSKPKKSVEFKEINKTTEEVKKEEKLERPGTSKSREEILEEKENELKSRESELSRKERELKEHEKNLKEKENELLTRENSLLTNKTEVQETAPLSLPAQLQHLRLADSSPPSATNTASSELLADVREQLKAMKKVREEIESEHTTSCSTPKEEFARLQDLHIMQQNLDEMKEEITTDREGREHLQNKVEDMKHEIETLQTVIKILESEKDNLSASVDKEINRLKTELKNSKSNYNEGINRIKMEMKSKDVEISELKQNVEKVHNHTQDLEKRVEILENDKMKYEIELQRYEKEVSDLRKTLEEKEHELNDLRNVLEETENEKDDLIDEIADLKTEMNKLKADKKRLEGEKKTLLARCVKPQWNQNPTGSLRRTTFK